MAALVYSVITSLDGYVSDAQGSFDWAAPDEDVHAAVNDLERSVGTYLYGRRMYDVMSAWESMSTGEDQSAVVRDYAQIWRAADKVVYSRTLAAASTPRTRVERSFDAGQVTTMKAAATRPLSVGGPGLAAQALQAGLVDEYHVFAHPVVVGGGTAALPDGLRLRLELLDQNRFPSGVVHLHYAVRG